MLWVDVHVLGPCILDTSALRLLCVSRSYVYHAVHSYFDRDNVALPNIAKYFNEQVRAACLSGALQRSRRCC